MDKSIITDLMEKIDYIISENGSSEQIVAFLVDEGFIEMPDMPASPSIDVLVKCIRVGWGEDGNYYHGYSPVELKVKFWENVKDFPFIDRCKIIWEGTVNGPTTIKVPPPPVGRSYQFHAVWSDEVWHKRTPLLPNEPTEKITVLNITHIDR